MSLAEAPSPGSYQHFNEFFTRRLRADARPIARDRTSVASPVDGRISQLGGITGQRLIQAKGRNYDLRRLLTNDDELATIFADGSFITIYLSPRDYHRIHMPLDGRLRKQIYVPGNLFAVNPASTRVIPSLFARNERVIAVFRTPAGVMAVILVGAIFVGSIETVWSGQITPAKERQFRTTDYPENGAGIRLEKGTELGRFNMGSTVILLFSKGRVAWNTQLEAGAFVEMGQAIGAIRNPEDQPLSERRNA
jgi:phosphatidylserine decarboxylase